MSAHDEKFEDSSGYLWIAITTVAFLFVTMPASIAAYGYLLKFL